MRIDDHHHADEMPTGRIARLFQQGGYGYIELADGSEIYFHGHSVLQNRYCELEIGDRVQFAIETGARGPRAGMISVIEHPHSLEWRNAPPRQHPPAR